MPGNNGHVEQPLPLAVVHGSFSSHDLYERWDRLRLDVFGVELGWHLPARSRRSSTSRDPFDEHAIFFAGLNRRSIVGIVRAVNVDTGFPHRELFETHLRRTDLKHRLRAVWTLNALAVVPSRRRERFVRTRTGETGTAASILLAASLEHIAACGGRVVLATVLSAVSAKAFLRRGFSLLDVPVASAAHQGFFLANVGIVLDAPAGVEDAPGDVSYFRSCRQYFTRCHAEATANTTIDALFASPERASCPKTIRTGGRTDSIATN